MDESYTHFGTQYGEECWCTGSLGTTETSAACTYSCAGNSGETCGGFDALSVYEIVSETTPPTDDPTPAPVFDATPAPVFDATPAPVFDATPEPVTPSGDFEFIGCVADDQGDRVMSEGPIAEDTMSAEVRVICYNYCVGKNAEFFGLQYSTECWCSMTFSEQDEGVCDMVCAGASDGTTCGGFDAIEAFAIN
ncbi:unnamed protein product [Ectocarpus sp. 6 AP-2014]